ncbi:PDZ superfamily [Arabidopsis thaliana x Arabidopsis arenosa]|uniref:PDZ superfamily n=1 Tax=Arabidopsis thaliana x Arabidopsis arenosa TaxID=1240361 RepID=A0A8T1YTE7_9BRAS|nr:PDZ superfamily [Arabidopsis thaliana x Arabidopsis arenosa]
MQVSILAGTLARLDRDAPHYKKDGYNDFNTFYMQAASGTKGGSSGSPVIDWQGRAVALNAGSKSSSASAFFLPLQRVVRALSFLQKSIDSRTDKPKAVHIPRGTLQMTFLHKGFDEIRRLGLRSETEQVVRHASPTGETGMLVVDSVVPSGPADKHLEPGDVLVRVNGTVLTQLLNLENLLDDGVGQILELEIERGGQPLSVSVSPQVQDLHSITPDHFLEVSGAARNFRFSCGLAYVADPGAGVPRHAIIKKVANEDISGLGDLVSVLSKLSRGARVPLEYMSRTDRHRKKSVCHEWYALPQLYTRNDSSGLWDVKPAIEPASVSPSIAIMEASNGIAANGSLYGSEFKSDDAMATDNTVLRDFEGATALSANASLAERAIERALIMFEVHVPPSCSLDGVHSQHFFGTGIIIYHSSSMGLAGVDKNTVAISASDVMLSFAAFPVEIPGEVVFLHPVHNYALIAYNPSAMDPASASVIRAAELLPEPALQRGDSVYLVGLSRNLQATSRKSIVTNPCAALNIGSADSPRYRATNMEVIELDTDFGSSFSGALTDEQGRIRAIWGSFSTQVKYSSTSSEDHQFVRGIPVYAISQVLEKIITGGNGPALLINGVKRPMPLVRILEVELYPTLLSKARSFGLSDEWIQVLVKKDPVRRQVLRVKGCLAGSKAENLLEQGDMVLAVNKMPVTCFNDIEAACQTLDKGSYSDENLNLTILRQGQELELIVGTDKRDGNGTTRAINWCGCVVQDPHPAVRALGFLPEEGHGVYVTRWCHGSPAHRYGLYALQWIVEVNGKKTPDLNAFADATKELEHGQFVRIRTVHLNSKPRVLTLKQDLHYWPTWELRS